MWNVIRFVPDWFLWPNSGDGEACGGEQTAIPEEEFS
jgi:hypothetical protein